MGVTFQINHEILEVVVSGAVNSDNALQIRGKTVEILKEKKIPQALIDMRNAIINISLGEIYFFYQSYYKNYPPAKKYAFVYSLEHHDPEFITFSKTVAANSGIFVKWFTDIDEARAWLMA